MERLGSGGLDRDQRAMDEIGPLERELENLRVSATGSRLAYRADELGEQLEELRVSLFAHELGTRQTVSVTRVRRAMEQLAADLAAAHRS
jgi:ATP-dependent helicase HrpA